MKRIRTIIEIDEVFQNIEPGHFYVLRLFGIPVARINQISRHIEEEEDD